MVRQMVTCLRKAGQGRGLGVSILHGARCFAGLGSLPHSPNPTGKQQGGWGLPIPNGCTVFLTDSRHDECGSSIKSQGMPSCRLLKVGPAEGVFAVRKGDDLRQPGLGAVTQPQVPAGYLCLADYSVLVQPLQALVLPDDDSRRQDLTFKSAFRR